MCLQVSLGLYMPNIHSLFVLGHHRHRFLSLSLSTYRLKVPEPTNERESCVEVVHAIVLGLPIGSTLTQPSKELHIGTHSGLR